MTKSQIPNNHQLPITNDQTSSFPRSAWECSPGRSASSEANAERSLLGSHAERGNQRKVLLIPTLCVGMLLSSCTSAPSSISAAKHIPIQHNGRIKPLEAFARYTMHLVTDKETWQGKSASRMILDALSNRDEIAQMKWIRIEYEELKESLGLSIKERYFSLNELSPSRPKIEALVKSSQEKRNQDLRPSMLEQKAEMLYSQLVTVERLRSGESIAVIPGPSQSGWQSPYFSDSPYSVQFKSLLQVYASGSIEEFEKRARQWTRQVSAMSEDVSPTKISLEVQYHNLKPFQWAWILYLAAFILLTLFPHPPLPLIRLLGYPCLCLAILLHTSGIVSRVIILGRPPVSNMYESMVYMNWALIIFATAFSLIRKNLLPLSIGAFVSALVMIYANLLPIDSSLDVLVPVLRSNYWLTIHVMTIVSSYGAFGLAMGLGHRHLFLESLGKFDEEARDESSQFIYRVMQVGILLIGMGTVLGGVWANESWGRFWGWDPKETWALITFLGYLVIVHLRFAKVIGPFGLALGSVLGFLLVLMTWYGVNFVLGRGLHSYGFGSGGIMWVIYYLVFEATFIGWVLFSRLKLVKGPLH